MLLYNYVYCFCSSITYSDNPQRQSMDRRRLEAAHIKYACLKMVGFYPEGFKDFKFEGDITDTLDKITPLLFKFFEQTYSGNTSNLKSAGFYQQ